MSVLDKLNFVDAKRSRPNTAITPVEVFIEAVDKQILAAKSFLKGEVFTQDAIRYVGEGEDRVKESYQRPLRTWFGQEESGKWFVAVRYGNRPLRITEDGKHAVMCNTQDKIIPTLKLLKKAAEAGELTEAIAEAKQNGSRKQK